MDLSLNQGQEMLRRAAREFLEANCPTELVRELETSEKGYSPALWSHMADLGWLGLGLPEEYGGEGGDVVDQLVLASEMGRALLPSPYLTSVVACGQLASRVGSPSQREAILSRMVHGQSIMSLSLYEDGLESDFDGISTEVTPSGSLFRLNGAKTFVPFAASAERLVCVARGHEDGGIVLCMVSADEAGVVINPMESIAGYPQSRVEFNDVHLDRDDILGSGGGGEDALTKTLEWVTVVRCGEMVGRGRKILEMIIDYAKSRIQFGRPIGAFQAIQHQLADLQVAVDAAELMAYRAACSISEGVECSEEIALAKAAADEMSRMATVVGHGVYAGISFTVEHDMQLYSARNRLAEAECGGPLAQIDRIAGMMGL